MRVRALVPGLVLFYIKGDFKEILALSIRVFWLFSWIVCMLLLTADGPRTLFAHTDVFAEGGTCCG
jgi:hypothetical protein